MMGEPIPSRNRQERGVAADAFENRQRPARRSGIRIEVKLEVEAGKLHLAQKIDRLAEAQGFGKPPAEGHGNRRLAFGIPRTGGQRRRIPPQPFEEHARQFHAIEGRPIRPREAHVA